MTKSYNHIPKHGAGFEMPNICLGCTAEDCVEDLDASAKKQVKAARHKKHSLFNNPYPKACPALTFNWHENQSIKADAAYTQLKTGEWRKVKTHPCNRCKANQCLERKPLNPDFTHVPYNCPILHFNHDLYLEYRRIVSKVYTKKHS